MVEKFLNIDLDDPEIDLNSYLKDEVLQALEEVLWQHGNLSVGMLAHFVEKCAVHFISNVLNGSHSWTQKYKADGLNCIILIVVKQSVLKYLNDTELEHCRFKQQNIAVVFVLIFIII